MLRFRCEGNTLPNEKYDHHQTPIMHLLAEHSKAAVKKARAIARKEHGTLTDDG